VKESTDRKNVNGDTDEYIRDVMIRRRFMFHEELEA
jgi:hypothetical protein